VGHQIPSISILASIRQLAEGYGFSEGMPTEVSLVGTKMRAIRPS